MAIQSHKWGWKREKEGKALYLFGRKIWQKKKKKHAINEIENSLFALKYIYTPAAAAHPDVFRKYKNCHEGKDIVLVAAGPTLDLYTPLPGAVHMGVNRVYNASHVSLDYLVAIDKLSFPQGTKQTYNLEHCKVFLGYNFAPNERIDVNIAKQLQAERFYYEIMGLSGPITIPYTPEYSPLIVMESVVTAAFQIALWMGAKRIFLVGCDSDNSGYFSSEKSSITQSLSNTRMRLAWEHIADFAKDTYPDVEVISVNPRGLRGLFRDMYMRNGELSDAAPSS